MQRIDKPLHTITGFSLLILITIIVIINLITPDKQFSDSENRVLERKPSFTLRTLISGKFSEDYERYVTDQFVWRDVWIGIKTDVDRLIGKNLSNGVYLGTDGYLIQSFILPPKSVVEERVNAITTFHQATKNLRKHMILAPTSASILRDKLPLYTPVDDERKVITQVEEMLNQLGTGIRLIDLHSFLYEKREQSIYYKTDHHWTSKGAYFAYRELCRVLKLEPIHEEAFDILDVTDDFYGSTYAKSGFRHLRPDHIELYSLKAGQKLKVEYVEEGKITNSLYEMDNLKKRDKYTVFMDGNHALVRITTGHFERKKLLVVKDSYANNLIPFLTNHFAEIDVVDLRYYEDSLTELVQERQYDDMILLYNVATFLEDAFILNIAN